MSIYFLGHDDVSLKMNLLNHALMCYANNKNSINVVELEYVPPPQVCD